MRDVTIHTQKDLKVNYQDIMRLFTFNIKTLDKYYFLFYSLGPIHCIMKPSLSLYLKGSSSTALLTLDISHTLQEGLASQL